jgi:prolyl-tRNA editing enzyme YbaK/EbsC (Cys-tRNA(Pro) deacylase)
MSIQAARAHLSKYNLEDRIREFDVSSATVQLAAAALGCEPAKIAKSISFLKGDTPIVIVTAGDVKIDNAKYKAFFGTKAKMLTPDQAIERIGHAVGGVCPFGVKEGVEIYLDESLKRFETVFPACGNANSAIELTPAELDRVTENNGWVDVCKPIT